MAGRIEKSVKDLIKGHIDELGFELVDVEFKKEKDNRYLRIFIYSGTGISIDDCVEVHRMVEPLIDENIDIEGSYTMEVSSPGYDRKFNYPEDFRRYMGETVELKLYKASDGKKVWEGTLSEYSGGMIGLETSDGPVRFEEKEVASVKRKFVFK